MVQRYKFSIELKNSPPDLSGEPFFVLYIVYQLGKQLDQINYRKWNYQKSQKGGSKMEPPFATIGFDLLIMIDSYYFSIATTPGSTLPSMASNMAPPPVET